MTSHNDQLATPTINMGKYQQLAVDLYNPDMYVIYLLPRVLASAIIPIPNLRVNPPIACSGNPNMSVIDMQIFRVVRCKPCMQCLYCVCVCHGYWGSLITRKFPYTLTHLTEL